MGRYLLWVVGVVALVLWACSGDGRSGGGYLSEAGAGDGFRVHRSGMGGGRDAIVAGIVEFDLDTGCVLLRFGNTAVSAGPAASSGR